jgi:hypothetical protein
MKKIMVFLTAMTLIAFTYMCTSAIAEEMKVPMRKTHEDPGLWIGAEVRTIKGDHLGTIQNFVRDSEGKLSFAIVSNGGLFGNLERKVATPYRALTYDSEKRYFTCAVSWDWFMSAPAFENEAELRNWSVAEEIYRYYGQRPYWTEESKEGTGSQDR